MVATKVARMHEVLGPLEDDDSTVIVHMNLSLSQVCVLSAFTTSVIPKYANPTRHRKHGVFVFDAYRYNLYKIICRAELFDDVTDNRLFRFLARTTSQTDCVSYDTRVWTDLSVYIIRLPLFMGIHAIA